MGRKGYTPELRQKFIDTAKVARGNGRGWDEALMLAKQEGYNGGLPGLKKLVREAEIKGDVVTPRRRGRPKKLTAVPKPTRKLSDIEMALEAVVRQWVSGLIAKIRAALDEAEKAL